MSWSELLIFTGSPQYFFITILFYGNDFNVFMASQTLSSWKSVLRLPSPVDWARPYKYKYLLNIRSVFRWSGGPDLKYKVSATREIETTMAMPWRPPFRIEWTTTIARLPCRCVGHFWAVAIANSVRSFSHFYHLVIVSGTKIMTMSSDVARRSRTISEDVASRRSQ